MKYQHGFFIVIISAVVIGAASCTPITPVGYIGGGDSSPSGGIDSLLVVPHRSLYSVNDMLSRGNDFSVFVYYVNNTMAKIPAGKVDIGIIENLNDPDVMNVPLEDDYCFLSDGIKGIVVFYNNISAQYMVQVIDPVGIGGGSSGESGGNNPGVIIKW
jgi:hypothetical protein